MGLKYFCVILRRVFDALASLFLPKHVRVYLCIYLGLSFDFLRFFYAAGNSML